MKVLILHNSYQIAGGEDAAVAGERKLLSESSHPTQLFIVSNDSIRGVLGQAGAALNTAYSSSAKATVARVISAFKPDIVHVHNFFPLLTPSLYDACLEARVPVVQTLHNYRTICANALLMRDGKICEDCVRGSPYQSVLHGCYRGSRLASLPVAHMIARHRHEDTWNTKVNRIIALTDFAKSKFVAAGLEAARISIKPNFASDPGVPDLRRRSPEDPLRALYVGRLSVEKGITTLVEAWDGALGNLQVIGDGPLMAPLRAKNRIGVTFRGRLDPAEVSREMKNAHVLIVPSECYEGFPMVIAEAFAQGLPVVGSRLGSVGEVITDRETGLLFEPGRPESLRKQILAFQADENFRLRAGTAARMCYEKSYSPEINLQQLLEIYEKALS